MTDHEYDYGASQETGKEVHLYFQSRFFLLKGDWQWNLHSQSICGSDVMHCLPAHFEGTKGLLHPDDVALVAGHLQPAAATPFDIQFRIITTYGKVEVLQGQAIVATETTPEGLPRTREEEFYFKQKLYRQELEKLQPVLGINTKAEKYTGTGTWYFNTASYDTYFSDNLYRLHGLSPQSVNAHLKSFQSFLHPDDAAAYNEAFDKAYHSRSPLHITYRIINTLGEEKYLQLLTSWDFNNKGEWILSGIVTDVTATKNAEAAEEALAGQNAFLKELAELSETMTGIGTWQINLLTRKTTFSANFYRIYGLKPQVARVSIDGLLNYVHPDDRARMTEYTRQLFSEHQCPETEFRVIRNDGKLRYLQLKGKVLVPSKLEKVMVGTIKDMTAMRLLEQKAATLADELSVQKWVQQEVEVTTETYVWVTNEQTGKAQWSQNVYALLGYRPSSVALTQKLFESFIHLEDQTKFTDTLALAQQERLENSTHLRLVVKGEVHYLQVTFKPMEEDGQTLMVGIMQNRNHQTSLQQNQHYLQQLVASLQHTITEKVFVTDRSNTIVEMNEGGQNSLLAKGQEAVHKNVFDVFPQLVEADYIAHLHGAMAGKPASLPAHVLHQGLRSGSYYLLPLLDEAQQVQQILHVVQDKTAEHQQHQKEVLHMRLMESIMRLMPGRVIIMDKHMNYVYWNERCEEHYGIKKEDVIGKNILEFSPGFYDDPSYNEFKRTLGGEVVSITERLNTSGSFYAEALLIPVTNDNGAVEFILWVVYQPASRSVLVSKSAKGF